MGTLSRGRRDYTNRSEFHHSNLAVSSHENQTAADDLFYEGADHNPVAVPCDYFGGVYEYIKQMLMEEDDLDHRPCMFQDCSALQAAEKYFYDALSDKASIAAPNLAVSESSPDRDHFQPWSLFDSDIISGPLTFSCEFDTLVGSTESRLTHFANSTEPIHEINQQSENNGFAERGHENPPSRGKKTHERGGGGEEEEDEGPSIKQLAGCAEESIQMEKYDKSLLCRQLNPGFYNDIPAIVSDESPSDSEESRNKKQYRKTKEVKRGRPKGSKKNGKVREVVDLTSLLTRCAEAVSSYNLTTGEKLLQQIRQHCSPYGDGDERLAHCFANALEARMTGTGSALYTASTSRRIAAAELLRSYQAYVTACPFKRMSNIFANKSIGRFTNQASRVHIIDFGILYGFQWPCIIQGLSLRPGGPPFLKITGIDFPQPGFRPEERVEQTGRRLVNYCKRFNVPFEYKAIAKKWDDIRLEDLEIDQERSKESMLVVNCLYRLRHVPDESSFSGVDNSPRDGVLKFIRNVIKPDLFVHGIVNGTHNAPFFTTRFREAQYFYSSLFDMMEATLPREDQDRLMYEREVFGRDVMNVVACEGSERVERPETYKQWQVRNQRAGFRPMALNKEIMREVKTKVSKEYHNDFLLDQDGEWMLQGWKGRVLYALSCWRPAV